MKTVQVPDDCKVVLISEQLVEKMADHWSDPVTVQVFDTSDPDVVEMYFRKCTVNVRDWEGHLQACVPVLGEGPQYLLH